ncbi:MAG: alpha/beta hydrolase [Candidatus Dactylopiibacterium carminicum]|uniref:Alpha/beta hydrolase n=1 Tax=Candidatus Dactylopiibacterium carminicum TaxID=857335 RepID=A0A272ENN5_9RHOO|nr:patatin-like phospholipase family protein [Candidatus Dactylopiibacterium carminicum]KAF7598108.1 alpha/beta hydrolase [Candidatus Dactylopiibacterium carminicum]PAS91722.1 MAG: alpha/beta hydrolase [Candidatus Dactylopiibacterium carminicum]PAS96624.1 MAG: alpha/beta hydrolase [Candidatus Dactylopiibacterium carminicum]
MAVGRKRNERAGARSALIISGGAPNATLMAGALVAFHELGLKFDVISTAGAGALLGLMYAAPANGDPVSTLASLKDLGVADPIYEAFPVNYKVFNKPGMAAEVYRRLLALNPLVQQIMEWPAKDPLSQFAKDSAQLMWACVSPSDLSPSSLGLCAHVPFAEQIIDFAAVPEIEPEFYVNAFNLVSKQMENFDKRMLSVQHLQAALSFPFLYPPTPLGDGLYIEGAALDCLNFYGLLERHPDLEEIVVFDILGAEKLLRAPRDLYDAWVMSIITPLIEIARDDLKIFEAQHLGKYPKLRKPWRVPLIEGIAEADLPDVFDWSRSNLSRLFDIGYEAGLHGARGTLSHLAG